MRKPRKFLVKNAIIEMCGRHEILVIDLFKINPIDPSDVELLPDRLHPNDKGHSILSNVVAAELLRI